MKWMETQDLRSLRGIGFKARIVLTLVAIVAFSPFKLVFFFLLLLIYISHFRN